LLVLESASLSLYSIAASCYKLKFEEADLPSFRALRVFASLTLLAPLLLLLTTSVAEDNKAPRLELSRPIRSWEFLPVVGQRAALFGNETGKLEAWAYPLKILRNFHLKFLIEGKILPAESLARTLTVRPESSTIDYAYDTFRVRETLFVPVHEPGAVIRLEVITAEPLEIEAVFERDLQLEWPAGLGGTYLFWDPKLHAFNLGEEQRKYVALVGSTSAVESGEEYSTNYSSSRESSFKLGITNRGAETKTIVIAASLQGRDDAIAVYQHLTDDYANLLRDSADYYQQYLERTVNLDLPDAKLQQAYDWSRISMLQGLVKNPDLGTGLVAGYRTSGDSQRPGFAWFFGRDSLWTSFALNASGDFATTKTAIDFLSKFQRADGKIEHEISQAANLVPWFQNFPYGYASADATPLYIIGINDYVVHSGDVAFVTEKWESIWKAYQFLRSTYDEQGIPQNFGIGHGWVEGGPLLPVKSELYQAGLGAEALRALANVAKLSGKSDVSAELSQAFAKQHDLLNQTFWSPEKGIYAFALDTSSKRVDTASVLATVPMWFGLLDLNKSQTMIQQLAAPDHQTDWGMRIISNQDPKYSPGGYHFGAVWPLFTGWASVGEYKYHESQPAYANLRANTLLALDGSLGHVTEVLSGDNYQSLSTSSPHQIWSAAMVASPMLRGMMGLEVDAISHHVSFMPHVPADWNYFRIHGVRVGDVTLDFSYKRTGDQISLEVDRSGSGECTMDFAPAFSPLARIVTTTVDSRRVAAKLENFSSDQHATVHFAVEHPRTTVIFNVRNDFGVSVNSQLPTLGSASSGLRIISESWDTAKKAVTLDVAGVAGGIYEVALSTAARVTSIDGAVLEKNKDGVPALMVRFPNETGEYVGQKITVHFAQQ
jgi:glycogen debranching enzyme